MDADPLDTVHFGEPVQQLRQGTPMIKVKTIIGGVLGYYDEFPDAPFSQETGFLDQFLHRNRTVSAAYERDGTVRTAAVTAFGYFQEGITGGTARKHTLVAEGRIGFHAERTHQRVQVTGAEPSVHFGDESWKLGSIAL